MPKAKTESTNPPAAVYPDQALDFDDPDFALASRYYAFLDQERNQLARMLSYEYRAGRAMVASPSVRTASNGLPGVSAPLGRQRRCTGRYGGRVSIYVLTLRELC